jgi:hypothetical protein
MQACARVIAKTQTEITTLINLEFHATSNAWSGRLFLLERVHVRLLEVLRPSMPVWAVQSAALRLAYVFVGLLDFAPDGKNSRTMPLAGMQSEPWSSEPRNHLKRTK